MLNKSKQESATIYQFPIGGRGGFAPRKPDRSVNQSTLPSDEFALTDAWYHEEAIRDARQALKP